MRRLGNQTRKRLAAMETLILVIAVGLWLVLVALAAFVPLIDTAAADRNAAILYLPRWHDDPTGGTRAA